MRWYPGIRNTQSHEVSHDQYSQDVWQIGGANDISLNAVGTERYRADLADRAFSHAQNHETHCHYVPLVRIGSSPSIVTCNQCSSILPIAALPSTTWPLQQSLSAQTLEDVGHPLIAASSVDGEHLHSTSIPPQFGSHCTNIAPHCSNILGCGYSSLPPADTHPEDGRDGIGIGETASLNESYLPDPSWSGLWCDAIDIQSRSPTSPRDRDGAVFADEQSAYLPTPPFSVIEAIDTQHSDLRDWQSKPRTYCTWDSASPPQSFPQQMYNTFLNHVQRQTLAPAQSSRYTDSVQERPRNDWTTNIQPTVKPGLQYHRPLMEQDETLRTIPKHQKRGKLAPRQLQWANKTRADRSMCFRCRRDKQTCHRDFDWDCYRCKERDEPCVKVNFHDILDSGELNFNSLVHETTLPWRGQNGIGTARAMHSLASLESRAWRYNFTFESGSRPGVQYHLPVYILTPQSLREVGGTATSAYSEHGLCPPHGPKLVPQSPSEHSTISFDESSPSINSIIIDGSANVQHMTLGQTEYALALDYQPLSSIRVAKDSFPANHNLWEGESGAYRLLQESLKHWSKKTSVGAQSRLLCAVGLSLNSLRWRWSWCGLLSDGMRDSAFRERVYRLARTLYFHCCNIRHELGKQDYSFVIDGMNIIYADHAEPVWHALPSEDKASALGFDVFMNCGATLITADEQAFIHL